LFDLPVATRDSVVAAFDSTVAATSLSGALGERRGETRRRAREVRFGVDTDLSEVRASYTKVDGATLLLPLELWARNRYVGVSLGGRAGYAFADEEERHDLGITLRVLETRIGVHHHHDLERFGWTDPHAGSLAALFGVDERQFMEREGLRFTLAHDLRPRTTLTLSHDRDDITARAGTNPFTAGGTNSLFDTNLAAQEGERRQVGLTLGHERTAGGRFWGVINAETAGRDLGGDLDYDRIRGTLATHQILPWSDAALVSLSGQVAAAPDSVPVQILADPSGRNGARGYPLRSLTGTHAIHLRVDYQIQKDLFRRARVPFLEDRRIQFIPFVDLAAAWTPSRPRTLGDTTLPDRNHWKWSAGIGVRKATGFGRLLSHVRVDVAWRLDRTDRDPVVYLVLENEPFPISD
jgi:hypothetical protein